MAAPRQHLFTPFNGGTTLNIIHHDDIPVASLRGLPYFTGEDFTTLVEHIRDIATLCSVHNITQENVALRLLVASLKGKALQWFRGLTANSIATWDALGNGLYQHFADKSDNLSLLEQLSTIQRAPHEHLVDFNYQF